METKRLDKFNMSANIIQFINFPQMWITNLIQVYNLIKRDKPVIYLKQFLVFVSWWVTIC